jgi:CO dehydrogenase/acetyl-CoA synthase beta subunit
MIMEEFGNVVDKCQITLITDENRVKRYLKKRLCHAINTVTKDWPPLRTKALTNSIPAYSASPSLPHTAAS